MKKNIIHLASVALLSLSLSACGYHLGGLKAAALKNMETYSVSMFENDTTYPQVAQQMTTALADAMQRDGTFRMVSPAQCDFTLSGRVLRVDMTSLRTDPDDTYLSSEIGLTVHVAYTVTDNKTGKEVSGGQVSGQGSYFNDIGNAQSARDAALSYATRKAASNVVDSLTLP